MLPSLLQLEWLLQPHAYFERLVWRIEERQRGRGCPTTQRGVVHLAASAWIAAGECDQHTPEAAWVALAGVDLFCLRAQLLSSLWQPVRA
jgi:hypothetical protein